MRNISPSLVSADLTDLAGAVRTVEASGADRLHLDVEDGVFVPNITFGFPVVKAVRGLSSLPLEVHLMLRDPEPYVERFAALGADILAVHWEALPYPRRVVNAIRQQGKRACLAFNPRTPLDGAAYLEGVLDGILLMSSEPDHLGESFIPAVLAKVREARARFPDLEIIVDGGITPATAGPVWDAGATTLVAGRAVFGAPQMAEAIRQLRGRK
jgi:ribulose-phosphate 3-epimerase